MILIKIIYIILQTNIFINDKLIFNYLKIFIKLINVKINNRNFFFVLIIFISYEI